MAFDAAQILRQTYAAGAEAAQMRELAEPARAQAPAVQRGDGGQEHIGLPGKSHFPQYCTFFNQFLRKRRILFFIHWSNLWYNCKEEI